MPNQVAVEQVHADGPMLAEAVRCLHDRSRIPRESSFAAFVRAAEDARSVRLRHRPAQRSAAGANEAVRLNRLLELAAGGPLGQEHLGQVKQAAAVMLEPARILGPGRRSMWHASVPSRRFVN